MFSSDKSRSELSSYCFMNTFFGLGSFWVNSSISSESILFFKIIKNKYNDLFNYRHIIETLINRLIYFTIDRIFDILNEPKDLK